jgi:leucyl-tRNA synthetase, archaeal and cytosolic family
MEYDPRELEQRWRERWDREGSYESDPTDPGEPVFITVPYPYPSGGMHIGHARTYTVPDAVARYRRLRGDNVLFPIGWHVTGTPIIGAVERLKSREPRQLEVLTETYGVDPDTLGELETPMGYATHFIEEHYKAGMRRLGLSIDWRREFTTNDPHYTRFITWQYETLRDRDRLEKGLHPVKFCTNEEQPVTTHDILEGETAEFQTYTLMRFGMGETVVPMATLRPETIRGVTNAFVNPEATYVFAAVDGEPWFIAAAAVKKLQAQGREVVPERTVTGEAVVGEEVRNPVTDEAVLILPAGFVDPENATGVVMSVPAHSPDDYLALQAAAADAETLTAFDIDPAAVEAIEPVPILEVPEYGPVPAADAVAAAGIERADDPALAGVTKQLYADEFHQGRLDASYGEFGGVLIEEAREPYREELIADGAAETLYEFTEEVICRCGGEVIVADQETWFLRYDAADWKERTHGLVDTMQTIPENTRGEYHHTIDWLNEWPCIRNYGLGTRLPWDDAFVIEPLSDSTIYMAYYTIAQQLRELDPERLDRAFFDALFYGPEAVEDADPTALALRERWQYWYPVDYRFSANDLISNHLTFYLFHHAELFEADAWPQGIVIMGMGLLEGQKMSSSKGHVILPGAAIERYGADTVRFFLLNAAEPWQDYDWRAEQVGAVRDQLGRLWRRAQTVIDSSAPAERPQLRQIDRWVLSRLQTLIADVTDAMERAETRRASQAVFYEFEETMRWYRRRTDPTSPVALWVRRHVLSVRLRLLAPFIPYMANELHEQLTGEAAEVAGWPEVHPDVQDRQVEAAEAQLQAVIADIEGIQRSLANAAETVPEADPDRIVITVAAGWKYEVYEAVLAADGDQGAAMSELMADPTMRERGEVINGLVGELITQLRERPQARAASLAAIDEGGVYTDAAGFLADRFDAEVEVVREADADAVRPVPFRPELTLAVDQKE